MEMKKILKEQIELINPEKEKQLEISKTTLEFIKYLEKNLRKKKIKADVFIGGSLAKGTLIKKKIYDADIFVRFEDKKNMNKLGIILKKARKVYGSRDYYQLRVRGIILEIIPVLKIKNPKKAENTTDLSYFHVIYILKKIRKNKKLADEIRLAKTFAYSQNCYGAESYIHGFSGYALELLICHYGSFEKFIRNIAKSKNKIIIDDSKFYKKQNLLYELNESKIQSPIILIDPTFKERNTLAGLNEETFNKFKNTCKKFIKKPSSEFFVKKNILDELNKKYKDKLKIVRVKTTKQAGDISGSKSKKFFKFFAMRLKKEFNIKKIEFDYNDEKNTAYFYLVLDKKKDEIKRGPPVTAVHNLVKFKKANKGSFIKNHIVYAKVKHDLNFKDWFKLFNRKEKKIMKQMSIKKIELFR